MRVFGGRKLLRQARIVALTWAKMSSTAAFPHGHPPQSFEPWTKLTHTERLPDWFAYNPRTMRPPTLGHVNGLDNVVKTQGFSALDLAQRENFDLLCLQETHLEEREVENFKNLIAGYENSYWSCSVSRLGYSGTAVISRVKPITVQYGLGIHEHDQEGRIITLEFDGFYLNLEKSRPVIVAGDLNCAHQSIDIHNPPAKTKSAGFTIEERESFGTHFSSRGFVDTFRKQHPKPSGVKTSALPIKAGD